MVANQLRAATNRSICVAPAPAPFSLLIYPARGKHTAHKVCRHNCSTPPWQPAHPASRDSVPAVRPRPNHSQVGRV